MEIEKELAFKLILKFKQTINYKCPICGGGELVISTECTNEIEKAFHDNPNVALIDLQNVIPTITTECLHCGHLDPFSPLWIKTAIHHQEQE